MAGYGKIFTRICQILRVDRPSTFDSINEQRDVDCAKRQNDDVETWGTRSGKMWCARIAIDMHKNHRASLSIGYFDSNEVKLKQRSGSRAWINRWVNLERRAC